MDNFKGTPGPWEIIAAGTNGIEIENGCIKVCEIIAENDEDLLTELEWANARLIAAAPDLLSALQACKYAMEHGDPAEQSTRVVWDGIINQADYTISQALGKEQ